MNDSQVAAQKTISWLKPPAPLDFEAINLADSRKIWRQEVELYTDLAMCGREESTKVVFSEDPLENHLTPGDWRPPLKILCIVIIIIINSMREIFNKFPHLTG